MIKTLSRTPLLLVIIAMSPALIAGDSDTQTITLEIAPIDEIAIEGDSFVLTIDTATAGSQPDPATASASSYSITTNGSNRKITASLDLDLDDYSELSLQMQAPPRATSSGAIILSALPLDAVTAITKVAAADLDLDLAYSATVDAGVVTATTRILTLTIVDGS